MNCGICGGEVRGYAGVLFGRPIRDWKHRTAPAGVAPHRPVLGTPVPVEDLYRVFHPVEEEAPPVEVVHPVVLPRPAEEVPSSARQLLGLAEERGWEVEAPTYFAGSNGTETVVVRARRRDLGVVGVWERRESLKDPSWKFAGGYRIVRHAVERVGSESLKELVRVRDEQCAECGSSIIEEVCSCN